MEENGWIDGKWIVFDEKFIPSKFDNRFKQRAEKGITTIKKGEKKSFQDLKKTHDLNNQDLFRYLQIRDCYIKNIKMNEDKIHPIKMVLVAVLTLKLCQFYMVV